MSEKEEYLAWLKNLKIGDYVCVTSTGFVVPEKTITKVTDITKTGRIKTKATKDAQFIDGEHKHGKWHSDTLIPVTQEILNEIKYNKHLRMIKNTDFDVLSPEAINSIFEIIKKEKETQP